MSADALLSRLDAVKHTGHGRWIARCPAHDDKHPSLVIRELDDGRVLVHCFAGCSVEEVIAAVGLTFDALYPERALGHHFKPERRPFPAADILQCVAFEALIVSIAASNIANGIPSSDEDRARLSRASERLQGAVEATHAR